jgi:hypothetical protein
MELQKALANTSLELHSYGKCLRNVNESQRADATGHTGALGKIRAASKYKFCIVSGVSGLHRS